MRHDDALVRMERSLWHSEPAPETFLLPTSQVVFMRECGAQRRTQVRDQQIQTNRHLQADQMFSSEIDGHHNRIVIKRAK